MAKKKTTTEDPLTEREHLERIARYWGRALALTIIAGKLEPGHSFEDEAIAGMDEAWEHVAQAISDFAEATA